jgi:sec-independent protein translocase protein TatA
MLGSLGWQELLIILVILALIFGASRVADLGGALGRGIREFRTEARGDDDEKKPEDAQTTADAAAPSEERPAP